jgi:hypothetical protein
MRDRLGEGAQAANERTKVGQARRATSGRAGVARGTGPVLRIPVWRAEVVSVVALFGEKQRFAAEVGGFWEGHQQLRRVDLWAAGRWWTCDDNIAFVPQFCGSVRGSVDWLRSGCDLSQPFPSVDAAEAHRRLLAADDGSREQFWFPLWGPTTDNVIAHVFRVGDRLVIPFEFRRPTHPRPEELGQVFVTELPEVEFVGVLEQILAALACSG